MLEKITYLERLIFSLQKIYITKMFKNSIRNLKKLFGVT